MSKTGSRRHAYRFELVVAGLLFLAVRFVDAVGSSACVVLCYAAGCSVV